MSHLFLKVNSHFSLNSVNQLIFVMVKYGVLFEVRAESLNIIQTNFGFKGLIRNPEDQNRKFLNY
jgi:hypothetical protein